MKPSRVTYLSLSDIEDRIEKYEKKYALSSTDFLKDRTTVPEDVALRWEAFLLQRNALREYHNAVRGNYLQGVNRSRQTPVPSDGEQDLAA